MLCLEKLNQYEQLKINIHIYCRDALHGSDMMQLREYSGYSGKIVYDRLCNQVSPSLSLKKKKQGLLT